MQQLLFLIADCLLANVDAPRNDILIIDGVGNPLECRTFCPTVPSCMAFTYSTETAECALKHDVGEKTPKNFTFLGSKICPGNLLRKNLKAVVTVT